MIPSTIVDFLYLFHFICPSIAPPPPYILFLFHYSTENEINTASLR